MAEYNLPYAGNYRVDGGVQAFVEEEISAGVFGDYVCLGNVIESTFTPDVEQFVHYSSLYGLKNQDKVITVKSGGSIKLTIDELIKENLEFSFQTSARTTSTTVSIPQVEEVTFAAGVGAVNSGAAIAEVLWVKPLSGESDYTEGASADYTVALGTGAITQTAGTTMTATETALVCYTVSRSTSRYSILSDVAKRGRLHIVSLNSAGGGASSYIYCPLCEIKPEGDLGLLNMTEAKQATLNFNMLKSSGIFGYIYTW